MAPLSCEVFLVVDLLKSNYICEVGPIKVILVRGGRLGHWMFSSECYISVKVSC